MKKKRLILSSLFLALTLTFVGASSINIQADGGDPQGGTEKKAPPPPPQTPIEVIIAMLIGLLR